MSAAPVFGSVRTEGGILPSDLLQRIAAGPSAGLPGLDPETYHLDPGTRLTERIATSWNRMIGLWATFKTQRDRLPPHDLGVGVTRQRWLLPLLEELGYGRLQQAPAREVAGKSYAVYSAWGHVPMHLVGCRVGLDQRTRGVAGAASASPHGLVQDLLNRDANSLWALVSNGIQLRVLRDSTRLTRQAYLEFDLESMMEGGQYADFALLWLVCHQSRFESEKAADCWLETWSKVARDDGARALETLRGGVEKAIVALGGGFLAHPANRALRDALKSGALGPEPYYRCLLRLVYRLIFLFVAEDRGLLAAPGAAPEALERYARFYSTRRLRALALRRRPGRHADLWAALRLVMARLDDERGCPELGLAPLGSALWSADAIGPLADAEIANADLLDAVRALAWFERDHSLRPVDYRNLGSEELGSVYESLLELHPEVRADAASFGLETAGGHDRKTSGSYYTPSSLIDVLLDSALEPVIDEALGVNPLRAGPNAGGSVGVGARTHPGGPEGALLDLKICDPACGSGHFLVAAAHRLARRLAAIRSGDAEPAPGTYRAALRDVIGRCLYGVDLNPMAVELCKVSLWLEAMEPGKPLSFLDHHLRCGNSLLGTTPELIAAGLPDGAFEPIEGDDRKIASALKKVNKREREAEQGRLDFGGADSSAIELAKGFGGIESVDDGSLDGLKRKAEAFERWAASEEVARAQLVADAWCAAFVWRKSDGAPPAVTTQTLRELRRDGTVPAATREEIARLAGEYRFFHWHLPFPGVFARGGFDVVLGNPPWERVKLQEKEWFASRDPAIATAPNKAARERLIHTLPERHPEMLRAFCEAVRASEGQSQFLRVSGRYPLCGRGDVNTYTVFAELKRSLLAPRGRVGCIVPSGIATDDTTKEFFGDLVSRGSLSSLFDFQSGPGLFADIGHARFKFCLLTMLGPGLNQREGGDYAFFVRDTSSLLNPERRFRLTADDIALLNPNTRTCPIFRTRRDAEITKAIYRRVPVLVDESRGEAGNPWGVKFQAMFHMSNDSGLFRTREQLEADRWTLTGNVFTRGAERYLPLYEAKMVHHYNHRFGDYADKPEGSESTALPEVPETRLADPAYAPLPRYWVPEHEVEDRLRGRWDRGWLLGWRDICRSTDERTVIAGVIPRVGVGHTTPLVFCATEPSVTTCFLANLSSFVLDFIARQKVGGTHLTYGFLRQFPILSPATYESVQLGESATSVWEWISARVCELVNTTSDMQSFARDLGTANQGKPWDPARRFRLRCELDAAYFHLYGVTRDDAAYILDCFPIVREKDERAHGEYRTKRVILEVYDEMLAVARNSREEDPGRDSSTVESGIGYPDARADGRRST